VCEQCAQLSLLIGCYLAECNQSDGAVGDAGDRVETRDGEARLHQSQNNSVIGRRIKKKRPMPISVKMLKISVDNRSIPSSDAPRLSGVSHYNVTIRWWRFHCLHALNPCSETIGQWVSGGQKHSVHTCPHLLGPTCRLTDSLFSLQRANVSSSWGDTGAVLEAGLVLYSVPLKRFIGRLSSSCVLSLLQVVDAGSDDTVAAGSSAQGHAGVEWGWWWWWWRWRVSALSSNQHRACSDRLSAMTSWLQPTNHGTNDSEPTTC